MPKTRKKPRKNGIKKNQKTETTTRKKNDEGSACRKMEEQLVFCRKTESRREGELKNPNGYDENDENRERRKMEGTTRILSKDGKPT